MKIFHISDLHFGYHQPNLLDAFFQDINQERPDVILISGDLTHRAKREQFIDLKTNLLDKINIPLVIVPGNHDIPFYNFFVRFIDPYKNYNFYVKKNYPQTFQNNLCTIIGIDSTNIYQAKDGRISEESMMGIKQYFSTDKNTIHLLSFHHNLEKVDNLHHPIQNFKQVAEFIKSTPINIICTGHLHKTRISKIEKNDGSTCLILHAGSLLCQRTHDGFNSYFIINLFDRNTCEIHWRVCQNNVFTTKDIVTHQI